ncbi:hypothetical protein [Fusobacterium ulcerans]|uniref:hypothetical protein n=1 Tax=Fusobacterium ulcerans TaxID=861 RepID=UPI001E19F106|nr:hypothetical protein [Fusobacterium ulcerans]
MLMDSNSQLTPEQKNLIFFFLQATDMDKTTEAEKEIVQDIFEMENYFESIENEKLKTKTNQLEEKVLNLITKLKNQYFDYGVVAREISEYKLSEDKDE